METNSHGTAYRLHIFGRMKWTVGILAAALIVGCGVGVDDPEGQAAAGIAIVSDTQALDADEDTSVTQGTSSSGAADGGTSSSSEPATSGTSLGGPSSPNQAPQDPIPAIDTMGPSADLMNTEGMDPKVGTQHDPRPSR